MTEITTSLLKSLPKTDLHCHFDGSIRIETLIELAKKYSYELPAIDPESLREKMAYDQVRSSLEEYLKGFFIPISVLQTREDIERCFYEICEDAHNENVWHIEIRYCPYLHIKRGLSQEEVVLNAISAGRQAEKEFGISVGHILCGLKHDPKASIDTVAQLAAELKNEGVVGFDMAGPEAGYPIKNHLHAIEIAQKNNLFVTLHAGESYGPASIKQAIIDAKADRIGHGTSLIQDEKLLQLVVEKKIGVESCPISNWHTGSVANLESHPIKTFLERGVRVSVNTDNRLVSNTCITKELETLVDKVSLNFDQIKLLLRNGFQSAFLSDEKKSNFIKKFDEFLSQQN